LLGGSKGPAVRRGEVAEGGGAGPATLRRLSLESGLEAPSSSLSRLRFARCGGSVGPMEGILGVVKCLDVWRSLSCGDIPCSFPIDGSLGLLVQGGRHARDLRIAP
jgi:hypothetical protein